MRKVLSVQLCKLNMVGNANPFWLDVQVLLFSVLGLWDTPNMYDAINCGADKITAVSRKI